MNKQSEVHLNYKILFHNKKKWAMKPEKETEEPWMHIGKWKKSIWKAYVLCNSSHMKSRKR